MDISVILIKVVEGSVKMTTIAIEAWLVFSSSVNHLVLEFAVLEPIVL